MSGEDGSITSLLLTPFLRVPTATKDSVSHSGERALTGNSFEVVFINGSVDPRLG